MLLKSSILFTILLWIPWSAYGLTEKQKAAAALRKAAADKADAEIIFLSGAEFEAKVAKADSKPWLIFFGANWCKFTQKFTPFWLESQKKIVDLKLDAIGFNIAKVECTKEEPTCDKYGVDSYPTVLLFNNGQKIEECMEEDPDSLVSYASAKAKYFYSNPTLGTAVSSQPPSIQKSPTSSSTSFTEINKLIANLKVDAYVEAAMADRVGALFQSEPVCYYLFFDQSKAKVDDLAPIMTTFLSIMKTTNPIRKLIVSSDTASYEKLRLTKNTNQAVLLAVSKKDPHEASSPAFLFSYPSNPVIDNLDSVSSWIHQHQFPLVMDLSAENALSIRNSGKTVLFAMGHYAISALIKAVPIWYASEIQGRASKESMLFVKVAAKESDLVTRMGVPADMDGTNGIIIVDFKHKQLFINDPTGIPFTSTSDGIITATNLMMDGKLKSNGDLKSIPVDSILTETSSPTTPNDATITTNTSQSTTKESGYFGFFAFGLLGIGVILWCRRAKTRRIDRGAAYHGMSNVDF